MKRLTLLTELTSERGLIMVTGNTSERGLKDGWTRDTLILRKEYLEKIRALSYWERRTIKEVIDEALGAYLKGRKSGS